MNFAEARDRLGRRTTVGDFKRFYRSPARYLAAAFGLAYATCAAVQESLPADSDSAKGMAPATAQKLLTQWGYSVTPKGRAGYGNQFAISRSGRFADLFVGRSSDHEQSAEIRLFTFLEFARPVSQGQVEAFNRDAAGIATAMHHLDGSVNYWARCSLGGDATVARVRAFVDKAFPLMTSPRPEWKLKDTEWWNAMAGKRPFPEPGLPAAQIVRGLSPTDLADIIKRLHWTYTGPAWRSPSGIVFPITVQGQNLLLLPEGPTIAGSPGGEVTWAAFRIELMWQPRDEEITDKQLETFNSAHPRSFARRVSTPEDWLSSEMAIPETGMALRDLLDWVDRFASKDAPQLISLFSKVQKGD